MWKRLQFTLALSALCVGLAVIPANASVFSRSANFLFACDGANKTVLFTLSGLGASQNRGIVGSQIALFENSAGLQYLLLRAQQTQLLTMGQATTNQTVIFSGVGQVGSQAAGTLTQIFGGVNVVTDASGNVTFEIEAACNPTAAQVQGIATVWFFSVP
jgi:hypothetical protein